MKKKVTRKFKSGGLHERNVVATGKLWNHLSIRSRPDIPKLCSAEHQVLRKETGKKNQINMTRSENCEFVWP